MLVNMHENVLGLKQYACLNANKTYKLRIFLYVAPPVTLSLFNALARCRDRTNLNGSSCIVVSKDILAHNVFGYVLKPYRSITLWIL